MNLLGVAVAVSVAVVEAQQAHPPGREQATLAVLHAGQPVAFATARVQQAGRALGVDLPAQPLYVDLDQIGERIVGLVPDVFGDLFAPDDGALAQRQILEQRVLLGGEGDSTAAHFDAPRARLDDDAALEVDAVIEPRVEGENERADAQHRRHDEAGMTALHERHRGVILDQARPIEILFGRRQRVIRKINVLEISGHLQREIAHLRDGV